MAWTCLAAGAGGVPVRSIDDRAFNDLRSLRHLDLSKNQLVGILPKLQGSCASRDVFGGTFVEDEGCN